MNDINTTISELVKIGESYSSKRNTFFSRHTHQHHATSLKKLNINVDVTSEERIKKVKEVVSNIYWDVPTPGSLIEDIHNCLCNASDFQDYKKIVDSYVQNAMETERYNIAPTMLEYCLAIDTKKAHKPKPVTEVYTYTS